MMVGITMSNEDVRDLLPFRFGDKGSGEIREVKASSGIDGDLFVSPFDYKGVVTIECYSHFLIRFVFGVDGNLECLVEILDNLW